MPETRPPARPAPAKVVAPRPTAPARPSAAAPSRPPAPPATPTTAGLRLAADTTWRGGVSVVLAGLAVLGSVFPLATRANFENLLGYAFLFAGVMLSGLAILFAALQANVRETRASRRGLRIGLVAAALNVAAIVADQFVLPRFL